MPSCDAEFVAEEWGILASIRERGYITGFIARRW